VGGKKRRGAWDEADWHDAHYGGHHRGVPKKCMGEGEDKEKSFETDR